MRKCSVREEKVVIWSEVVTFVYPNGESTVSIQIYKRWDELHVGRSSGETSSGVL
jgi:hypothetical protein